MPANQIVRSVVDFWFGAPDSEGYGKFRPEWFKVDAAFDAEIRRRFLHIWRTAAAGELGFLSESPEGCLALVLILDQFPRNMFRGTPEAFATDPHACRIANQALEKGVRRRVAPRAANLHLSPIRACRRSGIAGALRRPHGGIGR